MSTDLTSRESVDTFIERIGKLSEGADMLRALFEAKEQAERERDAAKQEADRHALFGKLSVHAGGELIAERDTLKALCADLVVAIQRLGLQADLSAHLAVLARAKEVLK